MVRRSKNTESSPLDTMRQSATDAHTRHGPAAHCPEVSRRRHEGWIDDHYDVTDQKTEGATG